MRDFPIRLVPPSHTAFLDQTFMPFVQLKSVENMKAKLKLTTLSAHWKAMRAIAGLT